MRRLFLILIWGVCNLAASASDQPLVILISIDGCRWDYPEKHEAPFLQRLANEGARTQRLTPAFPTKTFPNHYTLVTGLRPESHGIIHNKFYDAEFDAWFGIGNHPAAREGRWWGGEPIWLTAQRQGLRSACMFWPGTEADILGQYPDEWHRYDNRLTEADRVAQVLEWTQRPAAKRPHLITLYFEAVDSKGHRYGPDAVETKLALHHIDDVLEDLAAGLLEQGLWDQAHLIVTSDHGMTAKAPDQVVALADYIDTTSVEISNLGATGGIDVSPDRRVDILKALANAPPPPRIWTLRRAGTAPFFSERSDPRHCADSRRRLANCHPSPESGHGFKGSRRSRLRQPRAGHGRAVHRPWPGNPRRSIPAGDGQYSRL